MRPPPASLWLGLLLGAAAGCYSDDYLLGALCVRDPDCGEQQCCSNRRCRTADDCALAPGANAPFIPAYMACAADDECLAHGIPRCVFWAGATRGFCADYCVGDPNTDCDKHVFLAPLQTLPRTCIDVGGQSLCALDCSGTDLCPDEMRCQKDACVPTP